MGAYAAPQITINPGSGFVFNTPGLNQLINNVNLIKDKAVTQVVNATPIAQIGSSAVPGTWYTIASYSMANNKLPSIFTAQFVVAHNAVGANRLEIGLYRNGTRVGFASMANASATTAQEFINVAFFVEADAALATDAWLLRGAVINAAPAVTFSAPQGYRVTHWEV